MLVASGRASGLVVSKHRPLTVILENVWNLVISGQHEAVTQTSREFGYITCYCLSVPVYYGVPQFRERVYFLRLRMDWLPAQWLDKFQDCFDQTFAQLRKGHTPADVSTLLLPEWHPRIANHSQRRATERAQTVEGEVSYRPEV